MAMQPRERRLALALGLTVGLILLYWGFGLYRGIFSSREAQLNNLKRDVSKLNTKDILITKAIKQRGELEKRSLPKDPLIADSLYQTWLFDLVNGKLTEPTVTMRSLPGNPKGYEPLGYDVKGRGSLDQITKVLYDFYNGNHLHQITSLDIKPQAKGNELDFSMHVEAIILPGTKREDTLTTEKVQVLALDSHDEYKKAITERNLFAEYTPPAVKPTGTPLDLAKLAYVTNIGHGVDGRPTAWIYERNVNKTTRLFVGNEFQVAGLKGTVKAIDIDNRNVEIVIDGKPVTVSQDKSLGDTLQEKQK
ncbi:MAG: hypothetical protein WD894_26530 [Pirellulales bacterium]